MQWKTQVQWVLDYPNSLVPLKSQHCTDNRIIQIIEKYVLVGIMSLQKLDLYPSKFCENTSTMWMLQVTGNTSSFYTRAILKLVMGLMSLATITTHEYIYPVQTYMYVQG